VLFGPGPPLDNPLTKGISMIASRLYRGARVATLASALTVAVAAGGAFAQGPGGHHGPGPQGDMVAQVMQELKASLSLNTSQQGMWDAAAAQTKASREQGRALHERIKSTLDAELAKAEPDFAAVAAVADDVEAQGRTLRRSVRDQWLRVYATFSPSQKAAVRDAIKQRVARFDEFRNKMQEKRGTQRG
jgi:Spy/CpxP family protein refolding chaperone